MSVLIRVSAIQFTAGAEFSNTGKIKKMAPLLRYKWHGKTWTDLVEWARNQGYQVDVTRTED